MNDPFAAAADVERLIEDCKPVRERPRWEQAELTKRRIEREAAELRAVLDQEDECTRSR